MKDNENFLREIAVNLATLSNLKLKSLLFLISSEIIRREVGAEFDEFDDIFERNKK